MNKLGKYKLKDITTKIGSGATPRGGKNSYRESGISLIRSLNIYDLEFDNSGLAFIDQEQADNLSNVEVLKDDILINITGASVARCCKVPRDVLPARVNQHVSILRPKKDRLDPAYLQYLLVSPYYKHKLLTFAQVGATREALTKGGLEEFEIELPALDIQQKFASILSAFDDLIENNTLRIEILEEMARRIYREWFVHFRYPGHEEDDLMDSGTELGEIPEGWEAVEVQDVIDVNPRTSIDKDKKRPYLPMNNISENSMLIDDSDLELRDGSGGSKFKNNDTLFARITPSLENGKTGFVQFLQSDEQMALGSTEFIVLRSKRLNPNFVYCLARDEKFRETAIKSMVGASGRQRVRIDTVKEFKITLPSKDILKEFEAISEPIFNQVGVLSQKNKRLKETRDLLLPKLISGKLITEKSGVSHEN